MKLFTPYEYTKWINQHRYKKSLMCTKVENFQFKFKTNKL